MTAVVDVILPHHLRTLAGVGRHVLVEVDDEVSQCSVLDALERKWPALMGTVRDRATGVRRPFVRFFACGEDLSAWSPDAALPEAVKSGREPFVIVGAMAGG